MNVLKFCMVTTFYPPHSFGGDGIFVYRLANALARHGHTVQVVYDRDAFTALAPHSPSSSYPNHPNIILHPLSMGMGSVGTLDLLLSHQLGRPVGQRARLKAILQQTDFDVIHFHNISLLGGPCVLTYGDAIKICTLHDYWFVCAMHVLWRFNREACARRTCLACTLAGRRPPQLWRYTGSVARAVRSVDAFLAPSDFSCHMHAAQGFPAPIRSFPHFLPEVEDPEPSDPDDQYRHPRPYFLFVGRLEKLKGVYVLLERFRTYHAADLLIVGTGVNETELRERAKGLPHVHFLGWIEHHQLQELYRRAIAVIVPSLCYETFGLVLIEAFAARTPAIVHARGALPEVVHTGGGGVMYRTDDELQERMEMLRTQPALRHQLGEQGYQSYLEHYSEARHLHRYYDLIDELRSARGLREGKSRREGLP